MAAIHDALKSLTPIEWSSIPADKDELNTFLKDAFRDAQLLVDSIPIPSPGDVESSSGRSRANTTVSIASTASEVIPSSARPTPPPTEVGSLQKQWGKPLRLNPKENPLGVSVYKLAGKDGKGAWFGRRSIHDGLGFTKWKLGLEREFPETLKTQGEPGEGNIRGIGGERRLEYQVIEGVGTLEVYHLSAKFPGPTTPRDFVTLLLTSDSALSEKAAGVTEDNGVPRHYMVVSIPCLHPDAPERESFIRGQYQSVEFIREIPVKKAPTRSLSSMNLTDKGSSSPSGKQAAVRNAAKTSNASDSQAAITAEKAVASDTDLTQADKDRRRRSKTISFAGSRGVDAKGERFDMPQDADEEANPVEWIMLTRSDPGGSVPRFMVERGTPSSIVADASKFLDWACMQDPEEYDNNVPYEGTNDLQQATSHQQQRSELSEVQTDGHLAGLDGVRDPAPIEQDTTGGGLYGMMAGAASAAGSIIAAHTPEVVLNRLPGQNTTSTDESTTDTTLRRYSSSSSSTSIGSFASALQGDEDDDSDSVNISLDATSSKPQTSSLTRSRASTAAQEKELQKLEERKRKLDEKLAKSKEKELAKKSEDAEKEQRAIAQAEEKHQKEIAKQEEKYKREVAKLEAKRAKEERKLEERKRKTEEKDERTRLARELEEMRVERDLLRKERQILRLQVMELQAENTALTAKVGRLGAEGQEVLKDVKAEVLGSAGERKRASSLRGIKDVGRTGSRSSLMSELKNGELTGSREGSVKSSMEKER